MVDRLRGTHAEDLSYWQTSQSSPDTWVDRARRQIETIGGEVLAEGFGDQGGRSAYMLAFALGGEQFKIIWPVLSSRAGRQRAARIQAATMLYRDVKARCVSAQVLGARTAFFAFLLLPNGQTVHQINTGNLLDILPRFGKKQLTEGARGDNAA